MPDAQITPDSVLSETPAGQEPVIPPESNELPDWAKQKVAEANAEAAKYRVQKNDALANARTQVEAEFKEQLTQNATKIQELEDLVTVKSLALAKLEAAVEAEVPSKAAKDFASLLQGATPEEIKSHAETAKKLFGNVEGRDRPVDPTQGTGNPLPLNGDPILQAMNKMLGNR